jgi:hypothetical protein
VLTKTPIAPTADSCVDGTGQVFQYSISGLPPGEHAFIAEFPHYGWRILRWNDQWHGNWTGNYPTADAALEALRQEILAATPLDNLDN